MDKITNMKKTLAPLTLALALTLTACGGAPTTEPPAAEATASPTATAAPASASTAPSADPADAPMEYEAKELAGEDYAFAIDNTFGKFKLPSEPDPELSKLLKKLDDPEELTYVTVTVDNRSGYDEAHIHQIRAYDAAGKEYIFARAIDFVEVLFDKLPEGEMSYDEYMELFEEHTDGASPGELRDFLMISGDDLPDDFTRITVNAGGMIGEVDAVTLDEGKAQGMPLDFSS